MTDLINFDEKKLRVLRDNPSEFVNNVILEGEAEVFDYQKDVLDSESDRIAFVSGRQVGKSRTAAWKALHFSVMNRDTTTLITAPSRRQSSELFKQVKKEMRNSLIPDEMWGIERENRTIIELDNGSRIICLPAGNDGSTIRGYTADLIIVDEAALVPDEVFYAALNPMMATTEGTIMLLSTPYGSVGFVYRIFNKPEELEREWLTKKVPTFKNPKVDETFIKEQQKQLSSTAFKQEILGEFDEDSDSFFAVQDIDNAIDNSNLNTSDKLYLGVDPARHGSDPAAYTIMDGNFNVINIDTDDQCNLTDCIAHVQMLHRSFDFDEIVIDETSLGGGVVEILQDSLSRSIVRGITFSIQKKQEIYQNFSASFENGKVSLPNNKQMRTQLVGMKYEYTGGDKMKIHASDNGHDDIVDSMVLAHEGVVKNRANRQTTPLTF